MTGALPTPSLFATLGTDHHRFDRLIDWLDDWLEGTPSTVSGVVQHGASRPPRAAVGIGIVSHDELLERMRQAAVVVTQAGPGSILDARGCGLVPIAVPRLSALREVIDDHQVAFARRMALDGEVVLAETREQFMTALDEAFKDPAALRRAPSQSPIPVTAANVARVVEEVAGKRPGSIAWRRLRPPR